VPHRNHLQPQLGRRTSIAAEAHESWRIPRCFRVHRALDPVPARRWPVGAQPARRENSPSTAADAPPQIGRRPGASRARSAARHQCAGWPSPEGNRASQLLADRSGVWCWAGTPVPSLFARRKRASSTRRKSRPIGQAHPVIPLEGGDWAAVAWWHAAWFPNWPPPSATWLRPCQSAESCTSLDWPGLGIRCGDCRNTAGPTSVSSTLHRRRSPTATSAESVVVLSPEAQTHRWPGLSFSLTIGTNPPRLKQLAPGCGRLLIAAPGGQITGVSSTLGHPGPVACEQQPRRAPQPALANGCGGL